VSDESYLVFLYINPVDLAFRYDVVQKIIVLHTCVPYLPSVLTVVRCDNNIYLQNLGHYMYDSIILIKKN